MNVLELFAGAGGGILGSQLLGHRTVCAVEYDRYAASVLMQRQNDGILPPFPIWDEVRTFRGEPWRGIVDCVSGGFPCQDISSAGKGAGIEGEKSGLWSEMFRIVSEIRPSFVFVENSDRLVSRGLGRVLGDLASIGYDSEWMRLRASECGANHVRPRLWVLAHANSAQLERGSLSSGIYEEDTNFSYTCWGKDKPGVDRMANALAHRVDRLKAIGNGQVPIVAATAFQELMFRIKHT
tara:strand:- start:23170 stop:23883 length:714 start_codon:yes stop_codon:yes gene_type:complete